MSYLDEMRDRYRVELSIKAQEMAQEQMELQSEIAQQAMQHQSYLNHMDMLEVAEEQRLERELQTLMLHDQRHGTNFYQQAMAIQRQADQAYANGLGNVFGKG